MGVERVEEGIEGRRSGSPSEFEEEGPKPSGLGLALACIWWNVRWISA
jgi:hypothetical protein